MPLRLDIETIDFTDIVRPGDTVLWTQGAGEPVSLIEKLLGQRHRIGAFTVLLGASYSGTVKAEHADAVSFIGFGAVGTTRSLYADKLVRVIPCNLSALPRLIQAGILRFDVAFIQLSAAVDGLYSLGAVNGYAHLAARHARVAIAEINDQAPFTRSSSPIDLDAYHYTVHVSRPLVEQFQPEPGETERRIASHVARFVGDGDTLQIGIGAVPHAVAAALADRRDLGLHSGVIGDGLLPLLEGGVITNALKSIDRGKGIAGGLAGTKHLFDHAGDNRDLWLEPVTYTHDIRTLAAIDNLVSLNSAVEVDLTGQVGSEVAGDRYVGAIGGQNDFVRGALLSSGGRSVIALPSRSPRGVPRIVVSVPSGIVTVPRSDADIVVTEYGAAELRGRTIAERAASMIAIAHPDDRDSLLSSARTALAGW